LLRSVRESIEYPSLFEEPIYWLVKKIGDFSQLFYDVWYQVEIS